MIVFTIPLTAVPPTENSRLHWRAKARLVQELRQTARIMALSERNRLGVPPAAAKRAIRLVLVRGPKERLLDPGNFHSALKPTLDGVKDAGWIVDDSGKWIEYAAAQEKDNSVGPAVRVEIEVCEGPILVGRRLQTPRCLVCQSA